MPVLGRCIRVRCMIVVQLGPVVMMLNFDVVKA
jgi:hypothetical protein